VEYVLGGRFRVGVVEIDLDLPQLGEVVDGRL
jgi:hypothetical protein